MFHYIILIKKYHFKAKRVRLNINIIIHVCYKPVSFYILHFPPALSTRIIYILHFPPALSHIKPVSYTFYIFLLHYRLLKVAYLLYDMTVIKIQNAQFIFIGF